MDNASNITRGFTPASNTKMGNKMGLFMLKGPRLKLCHIVPMPETDS